MLRFKLGKQKIAHGPLPNVYLLPTDISMFSALKNQDFGKLVFYNI